jgi:hypothetical protein
MPCRSGGSTYPGIVSVAEERYPRYPSLHRLIEQLGPDEAELVQAHVLRLVQNPSPASLRVLRVFDGPGGDLGAESEDVIRREAAAS